MTLRIGILAGEPSGDLLGAQLLRDLKVACPNIHAEGIAGPAMRAAGCETLYDIEQLSVMGLIEPLKKLPRLIQIRKSLHQHFMQHKPDVFIGIDAPDFNFGLELKLRRAGIPIVHYVSPSVWAWRQYRIHKIAKAVDLMVTLLPFEAAFYKKHQVPVQYAGHPLAAQIAYQTDTERAKSSLCLKSEDRYIAILPGSRKQEIGYIAQPFLLAAQKIWRARPDVKFLTSHVNEQCYQQFYAAYKKYAPDLPLEFFTQRSHDVMQASDVVLVTSGTATLEVMLFKKPMVIGYRLHPLIYQIAKRIVKAPFIGLPNLLAGEKIVPELIQNDLKPDVIANHVFDYLDHEDQCTLLKNRYLKIHQQLRQESPSELIAQILRVAKHN